MIKRLFVFLLLQISWAFLPLAQAAAPRVGLVLSGGGARGSAHIGVLKVLEEMRVPIHAIVGTSMGALVGGTYASGMSAQEMARRVTSADWNDLFNDDPPRPQWPLRRKQSDARPTWDFTIGLREGEFKLPKGAIAGQKVQLFIADLVKGADGITRFDDLPIPFRAIATDLENGQMRVFDSAPMAEAMRASMSVPGLFAPMELDGHIYVDGGLVRNLPIDVARSLGVDRIIAVNLGSPYLEREALGTVLGVAGQMIAILTEQNVERSLRQIDAKQDILIVPELGDITAGDFTRGDEAIAVGEKAARAVAGQLAELSLSEAQYAHWRSGRFSDGTEPAVTIDAVRVAGLDYVNADLFNGFKKKYAGKRLDREAVEYDLSSLYGRGDFERLSYRVTRDDSGNLLIVDALEKAWGPGYLSFGLGLKSDFSGDNRFGIRGTYRQAWINELGTEWVAELNLGNEPRLFSEFYQPFSLDRAAFVAPYLDINRKLVSVFNGNTRLARYNTAHAQVGVDLGTTFDNDAELRGGVYLGSMSFAIDTGNVLLEEGSQADSGVRLSYLYDALDSAYVPRHGERFSLNYTRPLEAFGADQEYHRLEATWNRAQSLGVDTLLATLRGGSSFGDAIPYYDKFSLGGFLNLSGYANEQFRANSLAYASLIYYRRFTTLSAPLGRGLYLGGSLEYGYLWDIARSERLNGADSAFHEEKSRYGGSVFFGADTWLGPFYLGWGLSGEGSSTAYVLLGQP